MPYVIQWSYVIMLNKLLYLFIAEQDQFMGTLKLEIKTLASFIWKNVINIWASRKFMLKLDFKLFILSVTKILMFVHSNHLIIQEPTRDLSTGVKSWVALTWLIAASFVEDLLLIHQTGGETGTRDCSLLNLYLIVAGPLIILTSGLRYKQTPVGNRS